MVPNCPELSAFTSALLSEINYTTHEVEDGKKDKSRLQNIVRSRDGVDVVATISEMTQLHCAGICDTTNLHLRIFKKHVSL